MKTTVLDKKLQRKLNLVDWSFPKENSKGHITSLHPYPARFIPIIPRTIIDLVNGRDNKLNILDPFGGCGTTLVEGLYSGHNVTGIDVNGLAILLQKVYTHIYTAKEFIEFDKLHLLINSLFQKKDISKNNTFVDIPNVNHWFNEDAKHLLITTIAAINENGFSESVKNLARLTVSRILVKISNQQSDTQYRAIHKKSSLEKMIKTLDQSFELVKNKFSSLNKTWKGKAKIIMGDSRQWSSYKNVRNIDLVITSPPYPNAYEYWLYHKYRMFWLDMDPLWGKNREIGVRPDYSGNGKKNEFDFQNDIELVLKNIYKVTKKDAIQFWVLGDSVLKGRLIDNSKIADNACKKSGWKLVDKIERKMVRSTSSFQGIGRQIKEDILIMTK